MPNMLNRQISDNRERLPESMPHILCVDDDPEIQTAVELRMRDYQVIVEHAFFGMQGIAEAGRNQPDLILMDLAMPNGDGQYLLQCVKGNTSTAEIPVIVLTGMRDPRLKASLLNSGASAYLEKPVHFDDLLREIRRFIDLRKVDMNYEF